MNKKPGYLIIKETPEVRFINRYGTTPSYMYPLPMTDSMYNAILESEAVNWLIENIDPCHESLSSHRTHGGTRVNRKLWDKVSCAFVLCMDEHPFEILKTTSRIVYRHSKNHSWDHFTVEHMKGDRRVESQMTRIYDEVLAVQMKLQFC